MELKVYSGFLDYFDGEAVQALPRQWCLNIDGSGRLSGLIDIEDGDYLVIFKDRKLNDIFSSVIKRVYNKDLWIQEGVSLEEWSSYFTRHPRLRGVLIKGHKKNQGKKKN